MTKCSACGGVYSSVLADGAAYFHACAPLSDPEVGKALGLPGDSTTWTAANKTAVAATPRTRANARDENITTTAPIKTGAPMKSAGVGVTTVP